MQGLAGSRILVVEDEALIAMALEDILLDLGCEVIGPVSTVNAALDMAASERLDGALLDINVRGTLVYPVAEALIERGVPVVLCSGYALTSAIPAPYDKLPQIAKPYNPSALRDTLNVVFAGGKAA
ncbi:response regulator [Mongoliimonas terrestris]|uniref:response regulator n=1 Tax=Mongoliimonas terrestris TaxID=1709001 RepID=UPI0009495163|nr:response regulator [Mongoliimonas terrestris]